MAKIRKQSSQSEARIILATTDPAVFTSLRSDLVEDGIAVDLMTSLTLVADCVSKSAVQLLVLDFDGFGGETLAWLDALLKQHPGLPAIVVANAPTKHELLGLLQMGLYDFLPKPVDVSRIKNSIYHVCRTSILDPGETSLELLRRATRHLQRKNFELDQEITKIQDKLGTMSHAIKKHVHQPTVLFQMGRDISENENWSDALDRFLMAFVKYTQAEGAALLLFSNNEHTLSVRSSFQVAEDTLDKACNVLRSDWRKHPRMSEIHSLEGYKNGQYLTCLERSAPWNITVIPLEHRSRALGFLIMEKVYPSGKTFSADYYFLNTIQTIFVEQVANASYISELRNLSRFNRKVLENINNGVLTTDLDGNVRYYNRIASALCPRLQHQDAPHFNHIFTSAAFKGDFFRQIIESKKDIHVLEVECVKSAEQRFPARLSTSKMFDDKLNGTVVIAIFNDLTEQKMLEAEVRRNDRLRTLGRVSAGVAHEIRNPLTGIATSAEVLAGKVKGEEEKEKYLRAILEEIARLNAIITNLLDYARPAKPKLRSCSLHEVAKRVINLLEERAGKENITMKIKNNLKEDVCRADADQITQVLLNIVLNALQACKKGDSIEVLIDSEADGQGNFFARIDVTDTGSGIPDDIRKTLFEPFVTSKTRGSGLGLAISQQIVEEHRGKISCVSLSNGTKFTILLPMEQSESFTLDR